MDKKIKPNELNLQEKVIRINRVTNVVKGGRRFSFSALVVVGNQEGIIGFGLGKSNETIEAINKGVNEAKKNLIQIELLKHTIPHEVIGKYKSSSVLLKRACKGTGIIAGSSVRMVLESLGVENILTKLQGSSNPNNVVRATFNALSQLNNPKQIAQKRNITLHRVFHG